MTQKQTRQIMGRERLIYPNYSYPKKMAIIKKTPKRQLKFIIETLQQEIKKLRYLHYLVSSRPDIFKNQNT